nr:MAG TPA: HNHc [Caudoviricetes sp.]
MAWSGSKIKKLANDVISRYGAVCWLCHLAIDLALPRMSPGGFTIDHVVPRSKGGTDDLANLRPAHRECNLRRCAKPASAFKPKRPSQTASGWPGLA